MDDKSDIAELMQYFKKSIGEHRNFQKLCNRVKYLKETQEGVSDMCKLVEDYAKEYAIKYAKEHVSEYAVDYAKEYAKEYADEQVKQKDSQTAANLLQNGVSVDIVAKSIPTLTYDFILELSKKTNK